MLQRAAARSGRTVSYRAVVSNFDAAFRVVAANLAISVVPVEVGGPYAAMLGVKVIPLTDAWAQRRFAICFQKLEALQPPARRLVEHLGANGRRRRRTRPRRDRAARPGACCCCSRPRARPWSSS